MQIEIRVFTTPPARRITTPVTQMKYDSKRVRQVIKELVRDVQAQAKQAKAQAVVEGLGLLNELLNWVEMP